MANKNKKYAMIWPNTTSTKYINHHFTQLGEIADYLDKIFPNQITVLDADADNLDNGEVLREITTGDYKCASFYVGTENVREALNLSKIIKDIFPEIKLIAYGPLTILIPKFFRHTSFDAIYSDGDIEISIASFFNYSCKNITKVQLKGLYLIKNNTLLPTKSGQFIDLKNLGFSRFKHVPIEKYLKFNNNRTITITLSRGCPFSCPHCLGPKSEGHLDRRRDLRKLKDYLHTIYPKYKSIKIFSPNFTLDKEYVVDFCSMVKNNFPKLKWDCATRVGLVEDINLLKTMKKSGCTQITLGIESLSKKELKNIQKTYDLEKVESTIKNIIKCKINVKACIIIGIEGQTKKSLKHTIATLMNYGAIVRPLFYTPYQNLNANMTLEEVESYNRRFAGTHTGNLSKKQFVQIGYDIKNYKKILS